MFAGSIFKKILHTITRKEEQTKHCPICTVSFKRYIPLASVYKKMWKQNGFAYSIEDFEMLHAKEYNCPNCQSNDRDRLYMLYINKNIIPDRNYQKILDIAPSTPLSTWIRKNFRGEYTTADLLMDNVDYKVDIENMNVFADNYFDFVICSHVLEHVPSDITAMQELYRVLRKNGKAIIVVPIVKNTAGFIEDASITNKALRWKYFGQDDHVRLYTRKVFVERLQQVGFTIETATPHTLNIDITNAGIDPQSIIYIATK